VGQVVDPCFTPAMPGFTPHGGYFLCGTPRTGSTLLCGLLQSTGVAGRPESYFRQPNEDERADRWRLPRRSDGSFSYRDFVRAAIDEGSTSNGVFAARVMWGTLDEMLLKLRAESPQPDAPDLAILAEAFGPLRFVHLQRLDTLGQAVSWARAEQTQFWQHGDAAVGEPTFDFDQIDELVHTIDDHNRSWRKWFGSVGVQPYEVRYEDLTADPGGTTRALLQYLDLQLPADVVISSPHRRQADAVNAEWVARYRALAADRR
jgi:LPS sulfotransferase NodH